MMLLTKADRKRMVANFHTADKSGAGDFEPVIKLFVPWGAGTWLLTELNPETNVAYGLCDLGMGFPEIGSVSLDEIAETRGPGGLRIERDRWYRPKGKGTLSTLAETACAEGHISA